MPMMAAGIGAPASMNSNKRNSAVGALPMATSAPSRRSRQRSSAAAERVVPRSGAKAGAPGGGGGAEIGGKVGDAGCIERADHFVVGGKPRASDAVRHHLGVAENRLARQQGGTGGAGEVRGEEEVAIG